MMLTPTIICVEKLKLLDDLVAIKQKLQSQAYNIPPVHIIQQYLAIPRKMPKVEGQIFPGGIKGAMIDLITYDSCIEGELAKLVSLSCSQPENNYFGNLRNSLRVLLTESMDASFLLINNESFRHTLARSFPGATFTSWSAHDEQCQVYPEPTDVSCILMLTAPANSLFIVDTRDITTNLDIANLLRLGNFYIQKAQPKQPVFCVLVTNHINSQTLTIAGRCDIKVLISSNDPTNSISSTSQQILQS